MLGKEKMTMTKDSSHRRRSPDDSGRRRVVRRRRSLSPREQQQHKRQRVDDRRQGGPYDAAREPVVAATKVSLRGFDGRLSARDLAAHLESVAGTVWRCRVKTSVTPPGSYPDFQLPAAAAAPYEYEHDGGVPAHAFVHFAHPEAARRAARSGLHLGSGRARPSLRAGAAAAHRRGARPMLFPDSRVEVGYLAAPDTFLAAWRPAADASAASALDFVVDPSAGRCRLLFARDAAFTAPRLSGGPAPAVLLCCDVKLEFAVGDIAEVLAFLDHDSLLLRLSASPLIFYRTAGHDVHDDSVPFDLIDDDDDPWIRTTDISPGGAIGRCNVYRISFEARFWPTMKVALEHIKEQKVPVEILDSPCRRLTVHDELKFRLPMDDMFFCLQRAEGLSFPVLFLVNALMHRGIVNSHQLTPDFFGLLKRDTDAVNVAALTKLLGGKFQVFELCRLLQNAQDWAARNPKLCGLIASTIKFGAEYNAEVRRLVITPTRAYCMPPQAERSNRVIRHYHQVADRFLRVTFMDEGMQRLNTFALNFYAAPPIVKDVMPTSFQQKTTIYRRVEKILTEGFHLCGRRYSFLAFSSNQLRNRSAWFFAEDGTTTAASIREWMGQFPSKNVAKHTARMGQCFTSSFPTVVIQPDEMMFVEDVNRNGYNFSDGIGMITPKLALEVAKILPLTDNYVPSAFQIRFAGFKGVVAVWPGENEETRWLSLRPSMKKFESAHSVLEVVSWTKLQPAFLNRQIIILLSTLGVPDTVFRQMQEEMIHNIDRILTHTDVAYEVVTNCCPEHGSTAGLMLSAGFAPANEPHLRAMLLAIGSSQIQGLLEKTKIFVPKGRWLVGCLDEYGILEQGQCFIRASTPSLNKRFKRLGSIFPSANKNAEIIVGTVVIAKNPCLHPGDVRILEAVDVPELHHLVDCLVFPKKGERPHANEASGSDLDGDLYFVTWDEKLVPPGKKSCLPMDYSAAEAIQLPREVLPHDIVDFYLENMVIDNLGRISNAHVVHADCSKYGAKDEKCIQLAQLAAAAVDSLKTGEIVSMPTFLRPTEYPDFMGKEDDISYKSKKILGELYRSIKAAYSCDFLEQDTWNSDDLNYDTDLEVPGASYFLEDAWQCKCTYEAQLNALLNQYGLQTEAELVTGEAWSLTGNNKKQQYDTKERLSYAYNQLHLEYRSIFESIAEEYADKKNLAYEKKASAWYQVTYHPNWIQRRRETPPRLSFAWIAVDYLTRIKMRRRQEAKASEGKVDNII